MQIVGDMLGDAQESEVLAFISCSKEAVSPFFEARMRTMSS